VSVNANAITPSRVCTEASRPKRRAPRTRRARPRPAGQGQSTTVAAPQSTTRKRSGAEGLRSRCPAAPARNPPLATKKRHEYDSFPRQKKSPPPSFPLFGSPWRQAAAAAVARAPAPRESPSLSIFQSTAATKGKRPHRWREVGRYLVARLSHTDLVGFESSRRTQVRAARRRRRCTRARGSSPASCTRASSPTSGQ